MITIDEWLIELEAARDRCRPGLEAEVKLLAAGMAEDAKSYIGHEQAGLSVTSPTPAHAPAWDPLAPSTLADKRALGIEGADGEPLYRTGEMRESIEPFAAGLTGGVGSNDPVALWQEMGTARIPPRPFLARAVIAGLPVMEVRLGWFARGLLMPRP